MDIVSALVEEMAKPRVKKIKSVRRVAASMNPTEKQIIQREIFKEKVGQVGILMRQGYKRKEAWAMVK